MMAFLPRAPAPPAAPTCEDDVSAADELCDRWNLWKDPCGCCSRTDDEAALCGAAVGVDPSDRFIVERNERSLGAGEEERKVPLGSWQ